MDKNITIYINYDRVIYDTTNFGNKDQIIDNIKERQWEEGSV